MGTMPQLRVCNDKLTFWNEGALPPQISIDSLDKNHISIPRNPLIADVCFKAGYIDSWGRGTIKIYEASIAANLPSPKIEEIFGGIMVTLFKTKDTLDTVPQKHSGLTEFELFLQTCGKEFGAFIYRTRIAPEENIRYLRG